MKKFLILSLVFLGAFAAAGGAQTKSTYLFAQRDTCSLYLDVYMPADSVQAAVGKPVILFAFGGGFMSGRRDDRSYVSWFRKLNEEGYPVVSIDYRLGLKGAKYGMNGKFVRQLENAITIAAEDMLSATAYVLEHAEELGLEGRAIVTSGSSAGAITALQSEYFIANGFPAAAVLPEGFNYAGVMSFSGAIFSRDGRIKYKNEPCPQLLFHGTSDTLVPYKQLQFLNTCFGGSSHIAESLRREGRNYQIWRFKGHYHEIAASMNFNLQKELSFLEHNVIAGEKIVMDSLVEDPTIPVPSWAATPPKDLY